MSQSARGDIYPEFPRVGVRAANLLNARRSEEDEPPYGSRVFGMKSFADSLFAVVADSSMARRTGGL